ncbi:MAG: hypothetical protein K1W34_16985 [Lachnospiraceae bacterium]
MRCIQRQPYISDDDKKAFLLFLKSLLKGKVYVELAALTDNQLKNYWTSAGPYDEIFYYIKGNVNEVRDDFVLMISGEHVEAKMKEYAATAKELNTHDQIYSAMVVYGLLTYEDGEVFIPNKELMDRFNELLLSNESLGYVYNLARESEKLS